MNLAAQPKLTQRRKLDRVHVENVSHGITDPDAEEPLRLCEQYKVKRFAHDDYGLSGSRIELDLVTKNVKLCQEN